MTTKNPRITITLSPHHHKVLQSISTTTGQPMSAFVVDMLESAMPTIERMAVTFQKIKSAQDETRSRYLETIDEAQSAIEPVVMQALGQFDLFLGQVEAAAGGLADATQGATAGRRLPRRSTPPTNRGDTPPSGKRLQASSRKALKGVSKKEVSKKTSLCTCTITKHERQENRSCPVHFPGGKSR